MRYGEIIGAIGGSIAIFRSVWDGARWWRNRGKIEISVLRVIYHAVRYAEGTGYLRGHDGRPGGYIDTSTALDGRVKNAFTVLEFEIRSTHKQPVTVGMIAIEDWIFSERYHKHMYGPYQDYRVFDLYTRAPASLAPSHKLGPEDVLGRRVEIIEKSAGPYKAWYRYRVFLPDRNSFTIQLATSKGLVTSDAPITEVGDEYEVGGPSSADSTHSDFDLGMEGFNRIARWSGQDLIPGGQPDLDGEPHP